MSADVPDVSCSKSCPSRRTLHEYPMLMAVSILSPVRTQNLTPPVARSAMVSGTPSCSLSSIAVRPTIVRSFSRLSATLLISLGLMFEDLPVQRFSGDRPSLSPPLHSRRRPTLNLAINFKRYLLSSTTNQLIGSLLCELHQRFLIRTFGLVGQGILVIRISARILRKSSAGEPGAASLLRPSTRPINFALDRCTLKAHHILCKCSSFVAEDVLDLTQVCYNIAACLCRSIALFMVHAQILVDEVQMGISNFYKNGFYTDAINKSSSSRRSNNGICVLTTYRNC
ncbi:hypothetical protein Naga_100002g83 [Nannochloropsis gaditana]|uniref:Uncharacterized protein n=1 Tax=Nannochloropsis gaditana TaxID=72520 RepID=W7U763_9STRA|nr:hypothetical protein Naga_100002g83 [Nannochloropsis gaditana]